MKREREFVGGCGGSQRSSKPRGHAIGYTALSPPISHHPHTHKFFSVTFTPSPQTRVHLIPIHSIPTDLVLLRHIHSIPADSGPSPPHSLHPHKLRYFTSPFTPISQTQLLCPIHSIPTDSGTSPPHSLHAHRLRYFCAPFTPFPQTQVLLRPIHSVPTDSCTSLPHSLHPLRLRYLSTTFNPSFQTQVLLHPIHSISTDSGTSPPHSLHAHSISYFSALFTPCPQTQVLLHHIHSTYPQNSGIDPRVSCLLFTTITPNTIMLLQGLVWNEEIVPCLKIYFCGPHMRQAEVNVKWAEIVQSRECSSLCN